jgi:hypothetical protein
MPERGKVFCVNCMQKQAAPPAPEPENVGFSFEQLVQEGGALPSKPQAESELFEAALKGGREAPTAEGLVPEDVPMAEDFDPEVDKKLAQLLGEDEGGIRTQALTGSGSRGTPVWLSGLFAGGVGILMALPLARGSFGPILFYPYIIAFLGAGAALWSLSGMVLGEAPRRDRVLCVIGLVLGVITTAIAIGKM